MSDLTTEQEALSKAWLRKFRPDRGETIVFLSGVKLDDVIGFDKFLTAWHQDRKYGSLSPQLVQALKTFVLHWVLEGVGGFRVPLRFRNPKTNEEMEVECETDKMPDFTYNKSGVKSIEDLYMTYQEWMDAVADLKLNLAGPSRGAGFEKHEMSTLGGIVDASEDVKLPDLDGLDDINNALE